MKYLLFFLLLISGGLYAQDSTWYNGQHIKMVGKAYEFKRLKVDTGLNVIGPTHLRDSTFSYFSPAEDDSSTLVPNTGWIKRAVQNMSSNDSAYIDSEQPNDSTFILVRDSGIRDTFLFSGEVVSGSNFDTSAIYAALAQKVNISDTAAMLSPYLRGVDTLNLSDRIDALSGGGSGPLRYKILLTNSGGTFTVKTLENTLGDGSGNGSTDIAWTNPSNGTLRATMSSSPFTADKTFLFAPSFNGGGQPYLVIATRLSGSIVDFELILHDGTQSSTPNFTDQPILIEVYP